MKYHRKRNKVKFYLIILVFAFLILSLNTSSISAINDELVETKSYSNATLEDDFADDRVLVVLDKNSSFSYKSYSKEDFKDINCIQVEDLTSTSTERVKHNMYNANELNIANYDNYRRILSIQTKPKIQRKWKKFVFICI